AAVVGKDVPYILLQAVADQSEDDLRRGVTNLQAAEFLYETRLFPDLEYTFKHALTHEVAYGSLLQERRRALHRRIAEAIEAVFADRLVEHVERLAHHYTEAGLPEEAVTYWQQAGQRATERSANVEAIGHLTKGLKLLKTLPDSRERTQQELVLQTTLGPALMAAKGEAAPEVEKAYARARELCEHVGETAQLFPVLRGLWIFYLERAELQTARELAEQLLSLAQSLQDSAFLLEAQRALGLTLFWQGELASAQAHLEQGIALYDPQQHRSHAFLYGLGPEVHCLSYAAWALWFLGYPGQAVQRSHEALTLARELSHPFSLAAALYFAARLHQYRRERQLTQECAEAAVALSTEQGFPEWLAVATIVRGWALAEQGQGDEGTAQMRQGLAAGRATGGALGRSLFLALLAEAHANQGRIDDGLRMVAEGLTTTENNGERFYEAELHRLKGELVLSLSGDNQSEAETCFQNAIDIARRQSAKSLELRAATSLARLWQGQGRIDESRELLAPVYGWFTEGFDTADLKDAKRLLEELT
ncbi:MAG: hypothetical protein ACE5MH_09445, partial [Terriglobia bacterium]